MFDLNAIFDPDGESSARPVGRAPLLRQKPRLTPADLPGDWWVAWDERAAIMEHDGKLPRDQAEVDALKDILNQMQMIGDLELDP